MLPYLNAPNQEINMITQFGGYNHRISINENEFFDMKNMSSREFPLASTRKKRGVVDFGAIASLTNVQAMVSKDNLIFAYTDRGDIGVTIAENVAEGVYEDPSVEDGNVSEEEENKYTKVADLINSSAVNMVVSQGVTDSELAGYVLNGTTPTLNGVSGTIKDNAVYVKWEHEAIPKGQFWQKKLFDIEYVYSLALNRFRVKENKYLSNEQNREALKNASVFVGGTRSATITNIFKTGWNNGLHYQGEGWVIEIDKDLSFFNDDGKSVMISVTSPIPNELPAGKYDEKVENGEVIEINKPTKVKVNAVSPMHIQALKGQTLSIEGNDYHISNVETSQEGNFVYIDVPHQPIKEGSTAFGDRLYLAELSLETNRLTISDIFSATTDKRHSIIEMGANLVIFPEKVVVNTTERDSFGRFKDIQTLEKIVTVKSDDTKLWMVDFQGKRFAEKKNITKGNTAPIKLYNGDVWIDTSGEKAVVKVYSSQIEQWAKTQTWCSISSPGIGKGFEVGDAVELEFEEENIIGDVMVVADEQKYFVISKVEDDAIYFPVVMAEEERIVSGAITVKRTIPDMDFVIENENRLWGCKYGEVDGEPINEIFACKLGDPKNWHHFTNTSIDSYYVNLGADGEFTGAISYSGNPFFFREGCVHRIYGNYPSNYALKTINCHGVEKGSEKGITVMNDVMYYKSPVGIMAYTGATPVNVSEAFGDERYKNAVAGAVGSKMYFSMTKSDESSVLFVFDDKTKMWHKEDDMRCVDMVAYDNDVYALSDDDRLYAMDGGAGELEEDFEWYAQSGSIGYTTPFYKHIARVNLRMFMERNTRANISIQYDSDGNWHHITNLRATGKIRNISVPISPQRCDHFALKIEGKGECKILSITKFIEEGSESE